MGGGGGRGGEINSEFPVSRLTNGLLVSTEFNVRISNEKLKFVIQANFVTLVPVVASGFIGPSQTSC